MTQQSRSAATQDSPADVRAREVEEQMTDDDRFSLVVSVVGENPVIPLARDVRIPMGTLMSAGYTPGVPRLGVPALLMRDASLGVTNPGFREGDMATALPASIVLDSSFNPELARASGRMIALEARSRGFNVQLAGGINLARDPRNGRNFEYLSEDPLLSAVLAAESINGIQGEGVISTIKHYSLNCNETNRHWLDAIIDPAAHRESDLLAFEIAIERSQPGSVMTGYNKINGDYAGGNAVLLEDVLKGAWAYPGWVMSDWGATLSWEFALKGLDQESGLQIDKINWHAQPFVEPLKEAYAQGKLSKERLSDMVRRILRSMFAVGIDAWGPLPEVGPGARRKLYETFIQAIPDARGEVLNVVAEGDKVVILDRFGGTHCGEFLGRPGTGNRIEWMAIHMYTIRDGKILEDAIMRDELAIMRPARSRAKRLNNRKKATMFKVALTGPIQSHRRQRLIAMSTTG